jgi:hypothetical protein
MAKKKSKRVVSTQGNTQSSTVVNMTVGDGKGLSVYTPYISTPNFTLFFERPSIEFDKSSLPLPHMYALKNGFSLVTDGSKLVGIEFAKQISQLFINYLNAESISKHTCRKIAIGAQYFIKFIAEKYIACQCIEDLDFHMLHEAVKSQSHDNSTSVKLFLVKVLSRHPFTKTLGGNPSDIPLPQKKKLSIEDEDFDSLTGEINYSDREMCQILTYCVYEIERMRSQLNAINAVTKETLGDDFVGFEKTVRGIKGVTAKVIQFFKNKNYEAIYQNMLYSAQCERTGMAVENPPIPFRISSFVANKARNEGIDLSEQYEAFKSHVCRHYEPLGHFPNWISHFKLMDKQPTALVALYTMIVTGKNGETIFSIQRNYDGVPWYEHYDKYLGVSNETHLTQKVVRLIGKKQKGKVVKNISIRVPMNSTLFAYLKLLDEIINDPSRELFFNGATTSKNFLYLKEFFFKSYPVLSDDGKVIESINTRKIRKTFVGNLLLKAIDEVSDGESLVTKMQQALNHNSFDTTFHSYIMKTGTASHIVDASLVALTTDMLNKALHFQGHICEDAEQKTSSKSVYLCDCTDDTKPTHGIPIAKRCKKYDMCLGCERAEVYSHHIKNIWYRTMQYDAIAAENPLVFSGLLADRRQIAHDTIARFRCEHPDGEWLADTAFEEAVQAYTKGDMLVPPVMQF